MLKICFIGAVEFSKSALLQLIDMDADLCGVISNTHNKINSDYANLEEICKYNDIPFLDTADLNSVTTYSWIKNKKPDVIFCFGWSQLLKKNIMELAQMGVVGFHPSLLPHNRGRHPIIWALTLGLEKTGSTFFFMDEGADSGDILSQREVLIDYEDDAKSLYKKVTTVALMQIKEFVPLLENGEFTRTVQSDLEANVWRKRGVDDGRIDFRMSSRAIYNQVRALTSPYVGAHLEFKGCDIKIWRVEEHICGLQNIESGKVLDVFENNILVKTHDGAVLLVHHDFEVLPNKGDYL